MVADFGGTAVKYAVMDKNGKTLEQDSYRLANDVKDDFELFLEILVSRYTLLKDKYTFVGVAISSPGFVDTQAGIVRGASSIPCIHDFPIAKRISQAFDGLPVSMENDGNCSAYGEYWKGLGKGYKNVAKVVCGSGIGGGYVQNGAVYQTTHRSSSEFGFAPLVKENGKILDWSRYSVVNTAVSYNREQNRSLEAHELFDLAETQALEKTYVDKFYHYLAVGALCISFMLDPDIILIGGPVSTRASFSDNLSKALKAIEKDEPLQRYSSSKICASTLGNDGNLYGALYNFLYVGTCIL